MNSPARYDGRRPEPPYVTVTDVDEAERNAVERCAAVAEAFEFRMDVREWLDLTKKQISERVARDIADAIRNQ